MWQNVTHGFVIFRIRILNLYQKRNGMEKCNNESPIQVKLKSVLHKDLIQSQ